MHGDGDSTGAVRCTGCGAIMPALDFNVHDCPASPGPPHDDESWEDYKARCDAFRAIYNATTNGD